MSKQTVNNIRLGLFVLSGLFLLVVSLYLIGKKQNMFGSKFVLKARFSNVNGLMEGNNVRFSGIQAGTVEGITILNDTTIEVTLLISEKTKIYIHKNSFAAIGSEGLMGNKIVNIEPNPEPAPVVEEGDLLVTKGADMADMIRTLGKTNNNVADMSEDLKETAHRINNSRLIISLLDDTTLSNDIRRSLHSFRNASQRIERITATLDVMVHDVRDGKGTLGVLLSDTTTASDIKGAIQQIHTASGEMNNVMKELNTLASGINSDMERGTGVAHSLMKDSNLVHRLNSSMINIEKGTAAFNADMEALKHNFLFRGYFKKQERRQRKLQ